MQCLAVSARHSENKLDLVKMIRKICFVFSTAWCMYGRSVYLWQVEEKATDLFERDETLLWNAYLMFRDCWLQKGSNIGVVPLRFWFPPPMHQEPCLFLTKPYTCIWCIIDNCFIIITKPSDNIYPLWFISLN